MSDDRRETDADELLKALSKTELRSAKHGHLRVFLGMSPGVGKTFAMLSAARAQKLEGRGVLIGVVETHGRRETFELTQDLEILPARVINYRGVRLSEMDLDAILERRPEIVLVDELAHTNAPDSRHQKRYQDVLELLDAGIDVYTTVNVQHLESRKDLVERIIGVRVGETVPDSIIERADQIELVDIAPNELLKRLKDGKVYQGDRATAAAKNFFQLDTLTALREIALRITAEKVDHDLQDFHDTKRRAAPWQTSERLMVAVGHSPFAEKLIRATRRYAYNLEAPWIALHVDNGQTLSDADQTQLSLNISLARELNAEVLSTTDRNLVTAIKRVARQKNVTQIVIGRPPKRFLRDRLEGNLLERLVTEVGDLDVHVIRATGARSPMPKRFTRPEFRSPLLTYWNTACFIVGVSLLSGLLNPFIGYRTVGFVFLLGVMIVGALAPIGPTMFAAIASAFVWNFFFIPPLFTIRISDPSDVTLTLSYLLTAAITGFLTNRIRTQERVLREREDRANVLYEVSQDIAKGGDGFLTRLNDRIGHLLGGQFIVYLSQDGKLDATNSRPYNRPLTEKEIAVATWAFESGKRAGWSTDTLSNSPGLYIPLEGVRSKFGVLVFKPASPRPLGLEQENLLYSIVRQVSIALERTLFDKGAREAERLSDSEKLHQTLLNSISHELRTPLTTIIGSATALEKSVEDNERAKTFVAELLQAGDRLNRVIENLLDMSRLNSGVLAPKFDWQDIGELIHLTVQRLGRSLDGHEVVYAIANELPIIEVDFRLFEHALANIVLNAAHYSPKGAPITIRARATRSVLMVQIEDRGRGIPDSDKELIFTKFFRVPGTPTGGTGLGLSIAQNIIEAHGGSLRVADRAGGGSVFTIDLPLKTPPGLPTFDGDS